MLESALLKKKKAQYPYHTFVFISIIEYFHVYMQHFYNFAAVLHYS